MLDENKVVLGLSGGVDSSVAAKLLLDRGFDVTGVFLSHHSISSLPAEKAAAELGIDIIIYDISVELEEKVCKPFEGCYLNARTPNPCIVCNPSVKFPSLIKTADSIGAGYVATGHYARTELDSASGRCLLKKSLYENDQSYMLCRLTQEILSRTLFPLGGFPKSEIRRLARDQGLHSASLPDSMEICFIPDNDYAGWLSDRGNHPEPGHFLSPQGTVLGRHDGITNYTVGKRRGLRISSSERLYVKEINPITNSIILDHLNNMYTSKVLISNLHWISGSAHETPFDASVKLRHSKIEYAVTVSREKDSLLLSLSSPVRIPAPGQYAAVYSGDILICSGEIEPEASNANIG
jgi:tRNA-specific 2-thiouridylase